MRDTGADGTDEPGIGGGIGWDCGIGGEKDGGKRARKRNLRNGEHGRTDLSFTNSLHSEHNFCLIF